MIEDQFKRRQEELDKTFNESQEKETLQLEQYKKECDEQIQTYTQEVEQWRETSTEQVQMYQTLIENAQEMYQSLIEPLKQYEKEQQEKLFYTIQLPEEYHEDIEFLLTTVAAKVQHPDIISKLVWNEYVKNYLTDTCKRVGIQEEPGIYKLTSLINGKSYIGKSTNVKKRIQDHFKSVVGIQSIADQTVHHAIRKEGFWNWTIEIVIYAEKDKLNELEKFYIEIFDTQNYGYNRNAGGGG